MHTTAVVCKLIFLETFGISAKKARIIVNKKYDRSSTMTHGLVGKPSKHGKLTAAKAKIEGHLNTLPTVPSHYRRMYSKKRYFEASLTPGKLFELFKEKYPDTKISLTAYKDILKSLNIGFYKPKNDQCDHCTSYKNSSKE